MGKKGYVNWGKRGAPKGGLTRWKSAGVIHNKGEKVSRQGIFHKKSNKRVGTGKESAEDPGTRQIGGEGELGERGHRFEKKKNHLKKMD